MAIALADLLDPRHVKLALRSRSADNAIRELAELLATNDQIDLAEKFADQVIERERTNPSMVEFGVAFPHARTDGVQKIVLAMGRKTAGIPFGDGSARANLIFLIGVPQRLVNDYLIAVGALARIARNVAFREQLLHAQTADEFVDIVRSASSSDV